MSNTQSHAKKELEILRLRIPDAIILEFENEILALCAAFGNSDQSGASAPYTAGAISEAVRKLCLQMPISDIIGDDYEWADQREYNDGKLMYQNYRCSALFKDIDDKAYYLDAIVWKGEEEWNTFTGAVYINDTDFELIGSSQYVRFPFKPKTFFVDVVKVSITKEEAEERGLHYMEDNVDDCYYTILKDPKQLEEVFKYYDQKHIK
jgi:hypothetical protein